jgi:hypothetical protein
MAQYPDNPPSAHFAWAEAEVTTHRGIDNSIPPELFGAVINTAAGMEAVRTVLGDFAISINSWFRCPTLNTKIGSTNKSQHPKGEAVDFICPRYGSPLKICRALLDQIVFVNYDQLILEHTWVHISFALPGVKPKNQTLTLLSNGKYAVGLTDASGRPV